jgi:hypothetical protein
MKRIRLFGVALVMVMTASVPLASVANAQMLVSVPVQVAQTKAEANLVNDLAQCALQASGAKYLRGGVGLSQPPAAGANTPSCWPTSGATTNSSAPSPSMSTPAKAPTCVEANNTLTSLQFNTVNEYAILVARANSAHTPVPTMSPEVTALIGCL